MSLRYVLWSIILGVLLGLALFVIALNGRMPFSRMPAYAQVHIGMSQEQATQILRAQAVECGLTEIPESVPTCHFSDFKHNYLIAVSKNTGRIARKEAIAVPATPLIDLFHRRPQPSHQ